MIRRLKDFNFESKKKQFIRFYKFINNKKIFHKLILVFIEFHLIYTAGQKKPKLQKSD